MSLANNTIHMEDISSSYSSSLLVSGLVKLLSLVMSSSLCVALSGLSTSYSYLQRTTPMSILSSSSLVSRYLVLELLLGLNSSYLSFLLVQHSLRLSLSNVSLSILGLSLLLTGRSSTDSASRSLANTISLSLGSFGSLSLDLEVSSVVGALGSFTLKVGIVTY